MGTSSMDIVPSMPTDRSEELSPKAVVAEANNINSSTATSVQLTSKLILPKMAAPPVMSLTDEQKDHIKKLAFTRIEAYKDHIAVAGGSKLRFSLFSYLGIEVLGVLAQISSEESVESLMRAGVLAQISSEESVESLMRAVETFDQLYGDIQTLQQVVDDLEYKFGFHGTGVKSMEEMQRELHTAQDARENLESELKKLREERREVELDLKRVKWHFERDQKIRVQNAIDNLKNVEAELDQLDEENNKLDIKSKHLEEAIGPLAKQAEKHKSTRDKMKAKFENEYKKQAELVHQFKQGVEILDLFISKIERYEKENYPEKLKDMEERQCYGSDFYGSR